MKKQIWFCENCEMVGAIMHKMHAGVYEVIQLLHNSHKEQSPKCGTRSAKVRPMSGSIKELPEWAQKDALDLMAAAPDDPV